MSAHKQDHEHRAGSTDGRSSGELLRRIGRAIREGWVAPARPDVSHGILLVMSTILALGAFFQRGGMGPSEGTIFAGFAIAFIAEFLGSAGRRLVIAVRAVGMTVALVGLVALLL